MSGGIPQLELVLAVVDLLLEAVASDPKKLVRAQELARRDIAPLLAVSKVAAPVEGLPYKMILKFDGFERVVEGVYAPPSSEAPPSQFFRVKELIEETPSSTRTLDDLLGNPVSFRLRNLLKAGEAGWVKNPGWQDVVRAMTDAAALIDEMEKRQSDQSMSVLVPVEEYDRLKAVSAIAPIDRELLGGVLTELHNLCHRIEHVGDFAATKNGPFYRDAKRARDMLNEALFPRARVDGGSVKS